MTGLSKTFSFLKIYFLRRDHLSLNFLSASSALNSLKKPELGILVYEGQEFSVRRGTLAKSHVDWHRSILVIPVLFTQEDPQRCPTEVSGEGYVSVLAAHPSPHHFFGKAKQGGGTAAVLRLQLQDMIQLDGTSDDSLLQPGHAARVQSSFSSRWTPALPVPTTGGNLGTEGATVVHRRAAYPLLRQRPREESMRMNCGPMLSTTPVLLKPVRRVYHRPKTRQFVTQWKVGSCLKTFQQKWG